MEWVETTGSSVEEAKEAALDQLGVDEGDAEFEVVEEPKLGLFGRIRTEARVRARVRPTTPRAKEDRRDRRRRSRSAGDGAPSDAVGGDRSGPAPVAVTPGAGEAGGPGGHDGGAPGDTGPAGADASPASRARRRRRGGRGRGGSGTAPHPRSGDGTASPGRSPVLDGEDRSIRTDEEGEALMDVALDEQGKVAEQFVSGLLSSFGLHAEIAVTASDDDDRVDVKVSGDDLGMLIGPKGATLMAIQDLTRTVVLHRTNARNGRLYVDVAGYREKRAVALAAFARKVAADVLAGGRSIALEPMNPADRKLVHDTVTEIDGVDTRSVGEDERRHVVLVPAAPAAPAGDTADG